jgi:transcriptional regulator with XRE-family HTH domain
MSEIVRIGEKVVSKKKIHAVVDKALKLRSNGLSQQEVAKLTGLDRPFVSKLEKVGEIRKGRKIAVIGFPIENKTELEAFLKKTGVDFMLIFTDEERWSFVKEKQGLELFNDIMEIISRLRTCDVIVVIGSNYRINLCAALLDKEVVGMEIGKSPIEDDRTVDLKQLEQLFETIGA